LQPTNVFLMSNFKGWILDALARESAQAIGAPINIQYIPASRRDIRSLKSFKSLLFPKTIGSNLFFHHRTFLEVDKRVSLQESENRIWLTHFDEMDSIEELVNRDSRISKIYVQSISLRDVLVGAGFSENKLQVTPGAVDRKQFFPSAESYSNDSYFLFSGDCKPRKNPSYVEWIVRSFPEYTFVIHGRGWNVFNQGVMRNLSNVELVDFQFSKQGYLLRGASAFISVAHNEGGPISILEALASGTPVISTDTGFAKDMITHENGFLISENLNPDIWRVLFGKILEMKKDVHQKDLLEGKYTWSKLGADFYL
jgi:glycosyltransferase involved in cell wall biosynthesis